MEGVYLAETNSLMNIFLIWRRFYENNMQCVTFYVMIYSTKYTKVYAMIYAMINATNIATLYEQHYKQQ